MGCPKARNSNKVPLFLCHATLLLQHATPPLQPHNNHTTTTVRGLEVCWVVREGCGRKGDVAPPHYLPHHNHVRHSTTTSPVPTLHHQEGEAQLQGPCHRTSQIELCCKTSGDFSLQHATPPRHTATRTTQQSWCAGIVVVREGCGGKKGDVAPRYLPTTTTSATTHHNQSRKS